MKVEPVTLEGKYVRLEPMTIGHLPALCDVGLDESLWRLTTSKIATASDMKDYVESALKDKESGTALPFVTCESLSGKVIGSTRFGNIDVRNRRAEIGWTWIGLRWQRTAVNTEAKLLMLTHTFEVWKCIRVELKTDMLNIKSRAAIQRIGAKEEGVLRHHMITEDGRYRDSVYFSIIDSEWESVKANLQSKLSETR